MKKASLFLLLFIITCWAVPKPMESIENYSVLMVHGAYGSNKGFLKKNPPKTLCLRGFLFLVMLGA